ncbi:uncharacterized protein LOC130692779 [Daphnia carinata]|uniref:uncharacterized protein LOC130692779 n=1 Tax=Daphnia carinata TaxID=120202 RepID=UPI00257FEDB7|nr:uncharacterized protein LOC130692779 [Daphnia carinata]
MDEELLPAGMAPITVVPSTSYSSTAPTSPSIYPNLQPEMATEEPSAGRRGNPSSPMANRPQEMIAEEVLSNNGQLKNQPSTSYLSGNVNYNGGNVTFHSAPHRPKNNRKKSRKLTLTQVCSDEAALKSPKIIQHHPPEPTSPPPMKPMDPDRISNNSSLIGFESDNSGTSASTLSSSSSLKSGPERKINRIFSMLQSMQQTFMQQQQQPQQQQQQQQLQLKQKNPEPIYEQPNQSSGSMASGMDTIQANDRRGQQLRMDLQQSSASAPPRQLLYGLGRSQDSLMTSRISGPHGNKIYMAPNIGGANANNKGPIYASWNGSQCSGFTCTTVTSDGASPPLTHAMPFHKDGWTSLFIVGSSTYAQLLIVICIVAALSEVVTHNVPFLYFETFFAFLYTVSIVFFLYVFGYLLRSKRRREEKKRLRKLSRWRESNMANPTTTTEDETSDYDAVRNPDSSISVENEIVSAPTPLRRFFNQFSAERSGERRRFSRTDPVDMDDSSKGVSQNPHPSSRKSSATKQWMPQNFGLSVGDSPNEIVSYSTMNSNSDIVTNTSGAANGRKARKTKVSDNEHSHGSLFLRAGAVAFGLGTMIYDGLEFGAFLEVPPDSPCFALLRGINPLLHAAFVFLQMYFIFVSARLNIHKFKVIARFGLMHCVATNICVWIRTLVRESLKEINGHYHYYDKIAKSQQLQQSQPVVDGYESVSNAFLHHIVEAVAAAAGSDESFEGGNSALFDIVNETLGDALIGVATSAAPTVAAVKSKKEISLWELTGNVSCGRRIFLGNIIMDAAPFLYPFLIEYSLIGAAVLYVIWEHIGLNPKYKTEENNRGIKDESIWNSKTRQLRVDCVGASKGLFIGLFFLTASLLCLVLFFIFVPMPQFKRLGLILGDAAHCTLLIVSIFAMALGAYRARHLHFHSEHMEELGNILLRVSALGIFAYSVFSMIAGALANPSTDEPPLLVLITGLLSVIEVTVQMLFISDMSRRSVNTAEQDLEKPGRQCVTFLLITNMTLWLVYTFEMQKVEANPVQLNFYGFLPWAIIQRITLPLCIFYRFHSAIVYSEIWKNSYRYHAPSDETMAPGGSEMN